MNSRSPTAAPHRPQPSVAGPVPAPRLRIDIDRVTLHGFAGADRRRFARSLEAKLAELAAVHRDHDWSAGARRRHIRSLDAGELTHGAGAEQAARHIATALFAALTGHGKGARRV